MTTVWLVRIHMTTTTWSWQRPVLGSAHRSVEEFLNVCVIIPHASTEGGIWKPQKMQKLHWIMSLLLSYDTSCWRLKCQISVFFGNIDVLEDSYECWIWSASVYEILCQAADVREGVSCEIRHKTSSRWRCVLFACPWRFETRQPIKSSKLCIKIMSRFFQ